MLTAKIITAAVILLSVVSRAVMEFFWKDKRTTRYRYIRNCFIAAAIIGAFLNALVLAVDELKKENAAEAERSHRNEFENQSLGALTPDIWVFLYKDSKLICPKVDQTFPGNSFGFQMVSQMGFGPQPLLCLFVANTNSFPIYDVEITLLNETPNIDNTKPMSEKFPKPSLNIPILYPNSHQLITYDTSTNLYGKGFVFLAMTRKGITRHEIGLIHVSNDWEYASSIIDTVNSKVISLYCSAHFPRDAKGNPIIQVITQTQVKTLVEPASKP